MENQSTAPFVASQLNERSGSRRIARIWSHGVRLEAIANLAHELRTPVQVLLGYLEILRDEYGDQLTPKPRELIERMNANVHDLAQTIENVMHFVLAEAGAESIVDEDLSIEGLIAEITPTLEAANQHKDLRLDFDVRSAPKRIKASRRALRSIILNLGLNAIKFTESGAVRVEIRRAAAANMLELKLTDTGPGMNPLLLAEATRPFAQLSNSRARRYRGLGLGLAVVQRQIAAMNGQLELRPREGGGSIFVATVPVKIVEEVARPARTPIAHRKPAQVPPPAPAAHRKPARNPL